MLFKRKDKRIKGCWNPKCKCCKKGITYKATDIYCTQCRSELIYKCSKCGGRLEDINRKHRVCFKCEDRKAAGADARKEAAASVLSAVAAVGNVVADNIAAEKAAGNKAASKASATKKPESRAEANAARKAAHKEAVNHPENIKL